MLNKNVSVREKRYFKIAVFPAALQTGSPINEAIGTTVDEIRLIALLKEAGIPIDKVSILPVGQLEEGTASPFSTSAFGLNFDYVNLAEVPEFSGANLKRLLSYVRYPSASGEIDIKKERVQKHSLLLAASRKFHTSIGIDQRKIAYKAFLAKCEMQLGAINYNWIIKNAVFYLLQQEMIKKGYSPDFRKWPEEYRTSGTEAVKQFEEAHRTEIEDYCYIQFVCHEQQIRVADAYKKAGIKREVNLPFGCDPCAGAEVWALQGVLFDTKYNIGCYVEPQNGHDEQNWGTPQYIPGKVFEDFLIARYRYLAQYVDSIFIDHLCGFANKYYFPRGETRIGTKDGKEPVKGFFEIPLHPTDFANRKDMPLPEGVSFVDIDKPEYKARIRELMAENVYRILKIIIDAGLEVGGETMGDPDRQTAVEETIRRLNYEGNIIPLMFVLMYKDKNGEYPNIQELLLIYELFSGTHDTPNLVQMFCNKRGDEGLWFRVKYPNQIANFLGQGLGILVSPNQTPLKPENFTREMGMAVLERITSTTARTFTVTLQDLFALLLPEQFGVSDALTINRPSKSSRVGNPNANFSMRFPGIRMILEDNDLVRFLKYIAGRPRVAIDYPHRLIQIEGPQNFFTFASGYSYGRKVVYQNTSTGKWEIYKNTESSEPVLEMVIGNVGREVEWNKVKLPEELRDKVDRGKRYKLIDIASPDKAEYIRTGIELLDGLYIQLASRRDHHFIVYEI